jgi:cytochrome c biogenesis protein CcdA
MTLLFVSFIAGVLTALAPCTLPLIPIIVGRQASYAHLHRKESLIRLSIVIGSLALSLTLFTLLLKATTYFLGIPQSVWNIISGTIIVLLGIHFLFPSLWQQLMVSANIASATNRKLFKASQKKGIMGDILTGFAFGPVFSSCSPTYALIVATVIPASFFTGLVYLLAYIVGLCLVLFVVGHFGATIIKKLGWALDEHGIFRKFMGIIFIAIGIAIVTGFDKTIQTWLLESGAYDGTSGLEKIFQT